MNLDLTFLHAAGLFVWGALVSLSLAFTLVYGLLVMQQNGHTKNFDRGPVR